MQDKTYKQIKNKLHLLKKTYKDEKRPIGPSRDLLANGNSFQRWTKSLETIPRLLAYGAHDGGVGNVPLQYEDLAQDPKMSTRLHWRL